jgi:hypothetical protein
VLSTCGGSALSLAPVREAVPVQNLIARSSPLIEAHRTGTNRAFNVVDRAHSGPERPPTVHRSSRGEGAATVDMLDRH